MNFFDFFKVKDDKQSINHIHDFLIENFSNMEEERMVFLSCIAGLLARIAYVDFHVNQDEEEKIVHILTDIAHLNDDESKKITHYALEKMKELSGLDTRAYCTPLVELLSTTQRYDILKSLFAIAAADGEVDAKESNEISYIAKALNLENKYFLSARADVKEYILALK